MLAQPGPWPAQRFQCFEIFEIIALSIDWRLQNESFSAQLGMVYDPAEAFETDVAFADVCVPVELRIEAPFRVVRMDHRNIVEPENSVGLEDGSGKTGGGRDI